MWKALDSIAQFINTDLFTGYGLYTFAFVIWTLFRKPGKMLASWDESANMLVRYAGVFVLIYSFLMLTLVDADPDEKFNPFPWIQVSIWIAASQLLWINTFRTNRWLRFLVAFVLFFSMHQFVVFVTPFERDYIPASWRSASPKGYFVAIVLALITRAVTFVVFAYVFTYLRSQWTNWKINQ